MIHDHGVISYIKNMNEIRMISLHHANYQHRCIFDGFDCNDQVLITNQTVTSNPTPTEMIHLHTDKIAVVEDLDSCSDDTETTACTSSREDTSSASGSELTCEIQHMLSNESSSSSSDNRIDNYFEQPSRYAEDHQDYSPIDEKGRTKMIDWSYSVVSFNFPNNDNTTTPKYGRKRKHSIQALQIVSHAFALVDRYATIHQYMIDGKVMDRQKYKLVCMICLHISAKTSGLYSLNGVDDNMFEKDDDIGERDSSHCCCHDTPVTASYSDDSDIAKSQQDFQQRRPLLTILSLPGLLALSSNEYTISQLTSMELNILQALQWKGILFGTGGTVV